MTDNLKQRIAEAISGAKHFDDILPAVLNIVEPMIPKWMPIEIFPKHDDSGTILLKDNRHAVAGYYRSEELSGFFYHDYPDDYNLYAIEPTHFMPLPTQPAKE